MTTQEGVKFFTKNPTEENFEKIADNPLAWNIIYEKKKRRMELVPYILGNLQKKTFPELICMYSLLHSELCPLIDEQLKEFSDVCDIKKPIRMSRNNVISFDNLIQEIENTELDISQLEILYYIWYQVESVRQAVKYQINKLM